MCASKDVTAANCIRCLAADIVQGANSGHPGTPMGMAPLAHILWSEVMKYNPKNPQWYDRDRFVLSNGHGCALLYSMLHISGYDLPTDELKKFRQFGSKCPGHPERGVTAGVEVTTGPLGQGIANGVGLAMAEAHLAATFNRPGMNLVDHWTYVFCGDGCLMEGVAQESLSLAGHLALEKLIIVYDSNGITIDGETDISFTEKSKEKYEALGFHVINLNNADTDFDAIRKAYKEAREVKGKPKMIIARTTIGYGSKAEGTEKVHGAPLGEEDIQNVKKKFGFDPSKKYEVGEDVRAIYKQYLEKNQKLESEWNSLFQKYSQAHAAEAARFTAQMNGTFPEGWKEKLPLNDKSVATRKASENALAALIPMIPAIVGGSADLTPSNLTRPGSANMVDFQKNSYQGRYVRFGVREHAMCGIINGMDAHGGIIPYAGTFLNFFGYALGSIRIAALCHHRVVYVATHDSIGLGEDGPTHQPVELVAALRATPNLLVFRPSDQTETSGAWAAALEYKKGPSIICLSRQNTVPQPASSLDGVQKGAYVVSKSENPKVIFVSSGSEVSMAVDAAKKLQGEGIAASVVSMPCQELFEAQPQSYKDSIFPEGVPVISVEPFVSFGWERYSHYHIGMNSFGASAPAGELYKHFHITVDDVADAGKKLATKYGSNKTAPIRRCNL